MFLKSLHKVGIRIRLLALFVFIFGGIFVAFSAFLYRQIIKNHEEEFDSALYNYGVDVARAIDVDLFGDIRLRQNILSDSEKVFPFALGETYLQLHTADEGRLLAKSTSLGNNILPYNSEDFEGFGNHSVQFHSLSSAQSQKIGMRPGTYRLMNYFIQKLGTSGFVLQLAVPMRLLEKEQKHLLTFFILGIPVMLLLSALGGWFFSGRALAPVNAIIATSKKLSAERLSERVPLPETNDEIRNLAETLNALFDRLEQAFKSQETFISDASHQLKTPLAILRGELDLMQSKERSPEEMKNFLNSTSQEVNYLARIVEDLLTMARVDAGRNLYAWQNLRLDEMLLELSSRIEISASAKGVKLCIRLEECPENTEGSSPFEYQGDPDLLRALFENLLTNAVKYAPEQSSIYIHLKESSESLEFSVQDQGPGISAEDQSRIFTRFFRAESSRSKLSGSGLGLPIAKKIADLHEAKITVESQLGQGALFRVIFTKKAFQKSSSL